MSDKPTIAEKLAALRAAKRAYTRPQIPIAPLDAIIADYEQHIPALVEAADDLLKALALTPADPELVLRCAFYVNAALAHFTEAGGQGGEKE